MTKTVKKEAVQANYKIARDWNILEMSNGEGMSVKEIAANVGVTESCVRHSLATFKAVGYRGDIDEYIDLGLELCCYLDDAGCDADIDRAMSLILNELWVRGFNTRAKITKMTVAQRMEIGGSHRFVRAGVKAVGAFDAWLKAMKSELKVSAKVKKAKK